MSKESYKKLTCQTKNVNEVIRAISNLLFFFYEKILLAQKAQKSQKTQKA